MHTHTRTERRLHSMALESTLPLQAVRGIGPMRAAALKDAGIDSIEKLLYYFPFDYLDRSRITKIHDLPKFVAAGAEVTVIGAVYRTEVRYTRMKKKMFFLTLQDDSGFLTCVFFRGAEYFKNAFEPGEVLAVSSVPEFDKMHRVQFTHPDYDRLSMKDPEDDTDWSSLLHTGAIIPKYSSSEDLRNAGLDTRGFRKILRAAVRSYLNVLSEHLPDDIRRKFQLNDIRTAVSQMHFPKSYADREQALRRLKFDELFYFELLMAYRRRELKGALQGIRFRTESELEAQMIARLPFVLTDAQKRVISEIKTDMASPAPMNRLLQGDVGSGKTIVALAAMLIAVDNGYQAALMAPTEILAEQHWRSIRQVLELLNVNVRLLVGAQKKKLRTDVLEDIRRGTAQIVVGTHALLQEHVEFANLGLVVIDEQHRFGVAQRATLREKGSSNPDVLVMTATPIPRTLALTVYGDLDVSVIDELPKDRKEIRTALRADKDKEKIHAFIRAEVARGRQAYIVYPLIEESEKIDLKAATAEYERFRTEIFPELRVGLLHGRLASEEKDDLMMKFKRREIDILVATTVIEVGIDVPNATIMLIENADRFGLSQLHQLRGRVGRGADQSYCILLSSNAPGGSGAKGKAGAQLVLLPSARAEARLQEANANRRLQTMASTNDGFRIAEVDLELRGTGEFFGTRQSGLPEFKVANIVTDAELLMLARGEAFDVVANDPHLRKPEHEAMRAHFESTFKELLSFVRVG
ncbi:MAG TPA: ATP-dependent DNA helicase RecG [Bacteroidota bacterium]|nr:ATP-dependent DNA helicase RecG [Bacteroidota bacterium]